MPVINEEKIDALPGKFLNDFWSDLSFRDSGARRQTGSVN
jgi:hypothetical protein